MQVRQSKRDTTSKAKQASKQGKQARQTSKANKQGNASKAMQGNLFNKRGNFISPIIFNSVSVSFSF